MSTAQKLTIFVVALALVGIAIWLSPAMQYAAGLPDDAYHVVRRIEGRSGSVFLHYKTWGVGGGHEAAWVSLNDAAEIPDSSRDVVIHNVEGGVFFRESADSLYLMHAVTRPPAEFTAPIIVQEVPLAASELNKIRMSSAPAGIEVLH